jgi:TusA-related sulfurtransferase
MLTVAQYCAADSPTDKELDMNELAIDHELDCSGLLCPMPIIKTKRLIDTMAVGELLRLVATDKGSVKDVQAFSRQTGNELVGQEQVDGVFTHYIRKK